MQLSVIIPTLNESSSIAGCVKSARELGATEIIVADGGSVDDTGAIADSQDAQVVAAPPGRGMQMNAGAAASTGDVLLFLHADNWLPPEAREQIEQALRDPAVVHGAFRQRIDAPGRRYRWLEAGNAFRARQLDTPYGDQALFVRRTAWEAIGGFPDQPLMEDVVIARRLRRLGRPALLEGPLHVSARRWQENGVLQQTLTNWGLLAAWMVGVSPGRLASWYNGKPLPPTEVVPAAVEPPPVRSDANNEPLPPIGVVTQSTR